MSLGRIGSRAVVVGLGVLASLALMAAPSWAAKGGNGANAKLCEPGGYPGVLFNQLGEGFKNAGACTKYGAKGGQIAGVDVVAEPAAEGSFKETCSGFGLTGSGSTGCNAFYASGSVVGVRKENAANGTVSISGTLPCTEEGSKVALLQVEVFTAQGASVERIFPPPSGC
jgi:hypothetical protein